MTIMILQGLIFLSLFFSLTFKNLNKYEESLILVAIIANTIAVIVLPDLTTALVNAFGACVLGYSLYNRPN